MKPSMTSTTFITTAPYTLTLRNIIGNRVIHVALIGIFSVLAIVGLAGCGGTAAANTSGTQAQPAGQASSTSGDSMSGMSMPAEAAPVSADAGQASPAGQPVDSGPETVVQAALIEWSIQLSQSEVPAGKIRFVVTNQGTMKHNLTVEDGSGVIAKTANFLPTQGTQTLEVVLKPGTYTLICSIPGHAKKGQVATLVVK